LNGGELAAKEFRHERNRTLRVADKVRVIPNPRVNLALENTELEEARPKMALRGIDELHLMSGSPELHE
jgi:hypothetical protein